MRDRSDAAMARVEPERLVDEINKLNDQLDAQDAEIDRLRGVIAEASTKLKLLYMAAGLGQTTGRAALDALNAEITKLDAVTYDNQQEAHVEPQKS